MALSVGELILLFATNFGVLAGEGKPGPLPLGTEAVRELVAGLEMKRFRQDVTDLAAFGDRQTGTASFDHAADWVEAQLKAAGYVVEQQRFPCAKGKAGRNLWVTKAGEKHPDRMYLAGAHLDGRSGGGAADDDASGCALLLARALAPARVQPAVSIRMVFWDAEETGYEGSRAYVAARQALQGREDPVGSGQYPEPRWLGMIQHDMLLYDHGLNGSSAQNPKADIDVEYRAGTRKAEESRRLAEALAAGNRAYAGTPAYPVEIHDHSMKTDDTPFQNLTAAVSVRENRRLNEIAGIHPYYHTAQDLAANYSDADYALGFAAVRTTLGTVAELADTRLAPAAAAP